MEMKQISNTKVLNEAYGYDKPSAFSRGMKVDMGVNSMLFISGTASIDENGVSIHENNFEQQTWRAFCNVKALLESEGATWKDVVKTTIYIKDIEKNYEEFNEIRIAFFKWVGIEVYPASVCVQATLCRPELMIEMDAIAIVKNETI